MLENEPNSDAILMVIDRSWVPRHEASDATRSERRDDAKRATRSKRRDTTRSERRDATRREASAPPKITTRYVFGTLLEPQTPTKKGFAHIHATADAC